MWTWLEKRLGINSKLKLFSGSEAVIYWVLNFKKINSGVVLLWARGPDPQYLAHTIVRVWYLKQKRPRMITPLINIVNASKILALQYVSQNTFYTLFHRNANKTENLDPYHFIRNFFGQCLMCKGSIFGRWEIQLSKYYEVEIPVLISELEYSNLSKTV